MSIIGPRETHDYRNYNLLGSGTIKSKKKQKTVKPDVLSLSLAHALALCRLAANPGHPLMSTASQCATSGAMVMWHPNAIHMPHTAIGL